MAIWREGAAFALLPLATACCCKQRPVLTTSEVAAVCEPRGVTADETHAYLACDRTIERVSLQGGRPERIADEPHRPNRIAVSAGTVYWTSLDEGQSLKVLRRVGDRPETIPVPVADPRAPLLADAEGIVLLSRDPAGGPERGIVRHALPSGKAHLLTPSNALSSIAGDGTHLFWTVELGKQLRSVPKAGGEARVVATTSTDILSVAIADGAVYFCAVPIVVKGGRVDGGLMRVPLAGGAVEQLNPMCAGRELLVARGWLCWASENDHVSSWSAGSSGRVDCAPNRRVDLGERRTMVFDGTSAKGLVARGDGLFWVGRPDGKAGATTRLMRAALGSVR
jgi:sugar lactone lactonase YvrE